MVDKKEIERINSECLNLQQETPEMTRLMEVLKRKFDDGTSLTITEEQQICSALHSRQEISQIDFAEDSRCATYWFNTRYLLYCFNLNGHGIISNILIPSSPILSQYLNNEFSRIKILLNQKSTSDQKLNYYKSETNHQLKEYEKYAKRAFHGYFKREYQIKFITLHSWFLYLKVICFFQELGSEEIIIPNEKHDIVIDSYVYIHVLFRHFAENVTNYQIDKTFHFDQSNISHEWLPNQIKHHIETFFLIVPVSEFNERFISMKLKGNFYEIWFREMQKSVKGENLEFLRVQSFYPVSKEKDLNKIKAMNEIVVNAELSYFS